MSLLIRPNHIIIRTETINLYLFLLNCNTVNPICVYVFNHLKSCYFRELFPNMYPKDVIVMCVVV